MAGTQETRSYWTGFQRGFLYPGLALPLATRLSGHAAEQFDQRTVASSVWLTEPREGC